MIHTLIITRIKGQTYYLQIFYNFLSLLFSILCHFTSIEHSLITIQRCLEGAHTTIHDIDITIVKIPSREDHSDVVCSRLPEFNESKTRLNSKTRYYDHTE